MDQVLKLHKTESHRLSGSLYGVDKISKAIIEE